MTPFGWALFVMVLGGIGGGETPPSAVVRAEAAEFSIPVGNARRWRWARRETADNASEYRWEVAVASGEETYSFGFSLFKLSGTREASGGLGDLLNAGQASVWKVEETGGSLVKDALVSVTAAPGRVIVRVADPATMRLLFRHRPPTARIVTRVPDTREVWREVAISYVD